MTVGQQDKLKVWSGETLPRTTRAVGAWIGREYSISYESRSGVIDLETGQTILKDVLTVDAVSTIALLAATETMYPRMRFIHTFLDNARYHRAKLVQAWLPHQAAFCSGLLSTSSIRFAALAD